MLLVFVAECSAQDAEGVYRSCKFPYKVKGERDEVNFCTHVNFGWRSRTICPLWLDEEGYATDIGDEYWGDCSLGTYLTRKFLSAAKAASLFGDYFHTGENKRRLQQFTVSYQQVKWKKFCRVKSLSSTVMGRPWQSCYQSGWCWNLVKVDTLM